jgi:hypothetical protein
MEHEKGALWPDAACSDATRGTPGATIQSNQVSNRPVWVYVIYRNKTENRDR